MRDQRALVKDKVKSLERLLSLIDKATSVEKDLPRIVEEYDKYNKALRKETIAIQESMLKEQQLREKERAERERIEAKERERLAKEADKQRAIEAKEREKELER